MADTLFHGLEEAGQPLPELNPLASVGRTLIDTSRQLGGNTTTVGQEEKESRAKDFERKSAVVAVQVGLYEKFLAKYLKNRRGMSDEAQAVVKARIQNMGERIGILAPGEDTINRLDAVDDKALQDYNDYLKANVPQAEVQDQFALDALDPEGAVKRRRDALTSRSKARVAKDVAAQKAKDTTTLETFKQKNRKQLAKYKSELPGTSQQKDAAVLTATQTAFNISRRKTVDEMYSLFPRARNLQVLDAQGEIDLVATILNVSKSDPEAHAFYLRRLEENIFLVTEGLINKDRVRRGLIEPSSSNLQESRSISKSQSDFLSERGIPLARQKRLGYTVGK